MSSSRLISKSTFHVLQVVLRPIIIQIQLDFDLKYEADSYPCTLSDALTGPNLCEHIIFGADDATDTLAYLQRFRMVTVGRSWGSFLLAMVMKTVSIPTIAYLLGNIASRNPFRCGTP